MYLTSSDYEMVHDGGGEQVVGIRFPSVGVPAGVTVTDAYVLFDVDEVRPGASDADVTISVFGEKDVNAAAIGGGAFDLSSRTPTAAAVSWQPGPSTNVHDELKTPDLSPIVNEIINLQGWAEGNPMTILFGHVAGSGSRWVESFSTNNDIDTPALMVTYGGDQCVQSSGTDSVVGRPDGAEEDVATGAMYLTSSDYEV